MHITDDDDRTKVDYNPIIDTEIDFDCPYIDFTYVENKEEIQVPKTGVYDTLYYNDIDILTVNKVSEIEIRFYTSDIPNEKYRVGQRHIKGKVTNIKKLITSENDNAGYTLSFDSSAVFKGKLSSVTINEEYVELTKAKCIVILYFNDVGKIIRELPIPMNDWFSPKVYLNTSIITILAGEYPFKVGDIVDTTVYIKDPDQKRDPNDEDGSIKVIEKKFIGRLHDIALTKREFSTKDATGVSHTNTAYYYMITIDISGEYAYERVKIASTVIKSMKLHDIPEEEI